MDQDDRSHEYSLDSISIERVPNDVLIHALNAIASFQANPTPANEKLAADAWNLIKQYEIDYDSNE